MARTRAPDSLDVGKRPYLESHARAFTCGSEPRLSHGNLIGWRGSPMGGLRQLFKKG